MPAQVRAGPYFVLGRMHQHRSDYERALAAFLWLPTVYSENESLTSRACLEAAVSLERQGRVQNAITLLTEITQRHAWSEPPAKRVRHCSACRRLRRIRVVVPFPPSMSL